MHSVELFRYRCAIEGVHDGDTPIHVHLDTGFGHVYTPPHGLRLLGVDTPELFAKDPVQRAHARRASAFTAAWLAEHAAHLGGLCTAQFPYAVLTLKTDSFDRPLAELECGQGHSLVAALLGAGYPAWQRPPRKAPPP